MSPPRGASAMASEQEQRRQAVYFSMLRGYLWQTCSGSLTPFPERPHPAARRSQTLLAEFAITPPARVHSLASVTLAAACRKMNG